MKYPPQNTAPNQAEKQHFFSDKMMGKIRINLKKLSWIEFLIHTEEKSPKKNT